MLEQSSIQADFDSLCKNYGLRVDSECYRELSYIFTSRRQGKYFTTYELNSNFPALDIARMLKLLSFSNGAFSFIIGGNKQEYSNQALVDVLKKSLNDTLQTMVERRDDYLGVTYGSAGDCLVATCFRKGEYIPQKDGFSNVELDCIIRMGQSLYERVNKYGGNTQPNGKAPTRNPALGEFVLDFYPILPQEWNDATRNAFLADFLCDAGFLDFKGDAWKQGFKDKLKEDKDRQVRRWVEAYEKMLSDNPSIKESLGDR